MQNDKSAETRQVGWVVGFPAVACPVNLKYIGSPSRPNDVPSFLFLKTSLRRMLLMLGSAAGDLICAKVFIHLDDGLGLVALCFR